MSTGPSTEPALVVHPAHTDHGPLAAVAHATGAPQSKISAYYSLVLPDFTYYVQTLNVSIGRRSAPPPPGAPSGSDPDRTQADVDLGPLKSVSRLHAKIEYDEDEERFVLLVIGRNGAWVDGVWSGSGSKVPLGERSQIQIAARTFHFVLPPPPDDSPSPSSASSPQRARSPSLDITSISPATSQPSCSPPPPPAAASPAVAKPPPLPDPGLPNTNAIGKGKGKGKKRKKADMDAAAAEPAPAPAPPAPPVVVKPEVMPPKPPFTYTQLSFRAIKAHGGKATLQDICTWMMDTHDWYRYNQGAGWENSVRHNLSSGRAFKKMERSSGGDHGKGFFWAVDEACAQALEEQEAKAAAAAVAPPKKKKERVPKEARGGPLPPPFASTPLMFKSAAAAVASGSATSPPPQPTTQVIAGPPPPAPMPMPVKRAPSGIAEGEVKMEHPMPMTAAMMSTFQLATAQSAALPAVRPLLATPGAGPSTFSTTPTPAPAPAPLPAPPSAPSSAPALDPSIRVPIVVGPLPASYVSPGPAPEPFATPPIVLHENRLILDPGVFGALGADELRALEAQGAQRALGALQVHIRKYLRERMRGGKRGRGRGRGRGAGTGGREGAQAQTAGVVGAQGDARPLVPAPVAQQLQDSEEIVVVDDSDDEPAAKKRRVSG